MRSVRRPAARRAVVALILFVSGCSANSLASTPTISSPTASAAPSPSPPSSFTSPIYGYTVELPGGWVALKAKTAWNGTSRTISDGPDVDQWVGRTPASAWAYAAPYSGDLTAYTKKTVADNARYHGTTCPATPEAEDPITIGGKPGVLLAYDCGILINIAVTVHDGVGYTFALRDPTIPAATDPADAAIFAALLDSVALPAP